MDDKLKELIAKWTQAGYPSKRYARELEAALRAAQGKGCKCVCHEYPEHQRLQDALEALKYHQEKLRERSTGQELRAAAEELLRCLNTEMGTGTTAAMAKLRAVLASPPAASEGHVGKDMKYELPYPKTPMMENGHPIYPRCDVCGQRIGEERSTGQELRERLKRHRYIRDGGYSGCQCGVTWGSEPNWGAEWAKWVEHVLASPPDASERDRTNEPRHEPAR